MRHIVICEYGLYKQQVDEPNDFTNAVSICI